MKRIIVDYAKLTSNILNLLVDKFPEGYNDIDIIRFKNAQNELIEAVEVKTEDTIYLVKVSTKLASRMEKYDEEDDIDSVDQEDDIDSVIESIQPINGLDVDEDATSDDDDEEIDLLRDKGDSDEDEDEDEDDFVDADNFEDEEE